MPAKPLKYPNTHPVRLPSDILGIAVNDSHKKTVQVGEIFTITWRVMNLGNLPWRRRVLECQASKISPSLIRVNKKVLLPDTPIGGVAHVSIIFKAPSYPCTAITEWQLVDEARPDESSYFEVLRCSVDVLTAPLLVTG